MPAAGAARRSAIVRARRRALAFLLAACLAALAVFALDRPAAEPRAGTPLATSAGGSFRQVNSRAGAAIFSTSRMRPGGTTYGRVTIKNAGTLAGRYRLEKRSLVDTPGPAGGLLSERLRLRVRDSRGATVYAGPLDGMPARDLGRFAPGEARTYDFAATLPDGGRPPSTTRGDNAYKRSAASVRFVWLGISEEPGSGPPRPAPATPSDTRPPRLRVRIPRVQSLLRRRRLIAYVRCSERCTVRARGSLSAGRSRLRLGRGTRALRSGRRAHMRFRIPARGVRAIRRRLSRGRRVTITLRFTARDRAGNARTVTRRLHLRRR